VSSEMSFLNMFQMLLCGHIQGILKCLKTFPGMTHFCLSSCSNLLVPQRPSSL